MHAFHVKNLIETIISIIERYRVFQCTELQGASYGLQQNSVSKLQSHLYREENPTVIVG